MTAWWRAHALDTDRTIEAPDTRRGRRQVWRWAEYHVARGARVVVEWRG